MAATLIDGVLDRCHLVNIRGNSSRMRERSGPWQAFHADGTDEPRLPAR